MNLSRYTAVSRAAAVLALPQTWTVFAVMLVVALSLWGWWLVPAHWPRWVAVAAFLPALWGYVELMQSGTLPAERKQIMRWHRTVFAVTGLILALKLAPALAIASGQLDAAWEPLTLRIRWIAAGAAWAIWGNYLPKLLSPWPTEGEPFAWQRVHRFAGWVLSMVGVGIILAWLTLPIALADRVGEGLILAAVVLAIGRKLYSVATHHRPTTHEGSGGHAPSRN
jgi:hypothetical protein